MKEKQSKEIFEEVKKKATRGKAPADAGIDGEVYQSAPYTPAGDRVTPYEADEDLGEKGNIQE
ncbi:MAG: hypothetical protein CVU89_08935 [Firmicutes bacterium HGW-Firmicutes-14]|nr:MAG: hypothetical protein CVU89_08935 [Firmicutes bacterium HGW-Firmicutes-14]